MKSISQMMRERGWTTKPEYYSTLYQPTIPPMPQVKDLIKDETQGDTMNNFIELTIDNNYNLTLKDRYRPVLYNDKPIGFIDLITESKLTIKIWTQYVHFIPVFQESVYKLTNNKYISGYQMVLEDNNQKNICDDCHLKKQDTVEAYKERIIQCWDTLLPHLTFYDPFYYGDHDKAREKFKNLLNDILNEDYRTIEENLGIKLEK